MTEGPNRSRADLAGEFQRWLLRFGARGMTRELGDQFRSVVGRNERAGDVWENATAEPPPGEAPECAWCPVCRAARALRESGPGLAAHAATAGDLLTSVVQEAMSALDTVLAGSGRPAGSAAGGGTSREPSAWDEASHERSHHSPPAGPAEGSGPAGPPESPPHAPDHRG